MNFFKKNQMLIYVVALMLVVAGYLNYTSTQHDLDTTIQATTSAEELNATKNIGDAQLVSSNTVTTEENLSNIVNTENSVVEEESTETASTNTTNNSYFTKSKLERDTMYSQMIETYEKVLNGINSLETQKQSAAEEIKKINDTKNSIMIAENLITTKGFSDNIIFVNGESVSAIIGAEELSQEEISQIQNILARELNAKIENIHIAIK